MNKRNSPATSLESTLSTRQEQNWYRIPRTVNNTGSAASVHTALAKKGIQVNPQKLRYAASPMFGDSIDNLNWGYCQHPAAKHTWGFAPHHRRHPGRRPLQLPAMRQVEEHQLSRMLHPPKRRLRPRQLLTKYPPDSGNQGPPGKLPGSPPSTPTRRPKAMNQSTQKIRDLNDRTNQAVERL